MIWNYINSLETFILVNRCLESEKYISRHEFKKKYI